MPKILKSIWCHPPPPHLVVAFLPQMDRKSKAASSSILASTDGERNCQALGGSDETKTIWTNLDLFSPRQNIDGQNCRRGKGTKVLRVKGQELGGRKI